MTTCPKPECTWYRRRWLQRVSFATLGGFMFVYGLGVGRYMWPPYHALSRAKMAITSMLAQKPAEYRGEQELLEIAFTDPVISGDLLYPPITTLRSITEANQRIFMKREGYETAYKTLVVDGAEQLRINSGKTEVVRVRFRYHGVADDAYAFGTLPVACDRKGGAAMIIPGSELNQSERISKGDPQNYHYGVLEALDGWGATYVFIKPNEDFMAWHDGARRKLTGDFIWNWHLNREGSYSVSYLVQSLAFAKWMKGCFERALVAGLSQGGAAAMLNSLQSKPSVAVVASGYSLLNETVEWSGHDQLIGVPGYSELSTQTTLLNALRASPSSWLFTWGKSETGTYRIEAEARITATVIGSLPNVNVEIHDGGHVFPVPQIKDFLTRHLPKTTNP